MIHAYEPDYTTSFPLQDLSEDLFLEAAVKPENHSPVQAYDTLYCLSQVSQALKLRVDKCWIDFLQRLGKKTADFPDIDFKNPSPESLEKARKIVFQRAIDWMYVNPEVTQQIIPWLDSTCTANCFTNNFKAYPELWISNEWGDSLKCIDLMTQRIETFKLPEKVNPFVSDRCIKIVSAEKWMAIRCFDLAQETIAIIEKSSGTLCHRIENIYNVLKMHLEGKYLYVLSRNSEGLSKLLKYDTEDWEKEPWVLDIPGFVIKFHYSSHGLLFIKQAPDKLFQMLHIKNHIFSNETPVFIESAPQSQFPHIKIADDGFLTFTSAEDTSEDNPSVWLEKLCFENSTIAKKPLQKLPLDYDSIRDFEILFDKVIINSKNYAGNACSFFDLTNGNLIKDLISTMTVSNELFYTLQLLPNKSIQLLSDDGRNLQTRIGINLDFKI